MPRGDKSAYTDKQKRQAVHIEGNYRDKGVSAEEAEARAWVTVNMEDGSGKKMGSARKSATSKSAAKKTVVKKSSARKSPTRTAAKKTATRKKR